MNHIWFPLQRAIRTAAQVLVASVAVLAATVVVAPQILTAVQDVLPGPVVAWLAGGIAVLAAISAALSRVMAIPAVNAWLQRLGLGTAPAGAAVGRGATGEPIGMTRREWRAYVEAEQKKLTVAHVAD